MTANIITTATQEIGRGATPEQALWIAVLSNAVHDATMRLSYLTSFNSIMIRERAREYLRGDSQGFRTVCDYAGVEPARVRAALELAISRDKHEARNQRIAKQRLQEAVNRLEKTRQLKTLRQKREQIKLAMAALKAEHDALQGRLAV